MTPVTAPIEVGRGTFESGGESIYFETAGSDGPWVVLTHGAGSTHAHWYQQVPVLAGSFRVVTWDQRGYGRSTNRGGRPGPASAAQDLSALLDHLGVRRAHLVGQSMGGWAAVGVAVERPDVAASVVLASTVGGIFTPEAASSYDSFVAEAAAAARSRRASRLGWDNLHGEIVPGDPARSFLYQELSSFADPPLAEVGALLRATSFLDSAPPRLTMPVLLMVGGRDPVFPPAAMRSVAELLPDARVVEIPGAGHSAYFEVPGSWNHHVVGFLSSL